MAKPSEVSEPLVLMASSASARLRVMKERASGEYPASGRASLYLSRFGLENELIRLRRFLSPGDDPLRLFPALAELRWRLRLGAEGSRSEFKD